MATTQKIRNDIAKTKEKIAEQQKRLRALEAQLAEEENLEIVRMVKAVKMDNKELTAFLKAYASGMISLPEGMLQEGDTENEETEGYERMKHNFMTKMASALLAVVFSTAAFSVTAFASGGEETTVSVTEDGIQFSSGENDSGQTGTVTTGGGNLDVRTGAGMDYTAFTQLPNGATVKVIGTDGDWLKVILPEKIGYVYSGYMTVSDGEAGFGEDSFSLDAETLENLLGMLGGGLNGGAALTPDGNLSLIDDIGSPTASGKQFITVETKNGNVFYLIIDRDDEGEETVHFLNQVDEADLMALTEDGEKAETPIVCTCTEKCQTGEVNTACPVCVKNLSECVGTEQKAAEPTELENPKPEKKSNTGAILAVLLILAAGGGAAVYFLVLKPKQGKKVPADLDDFDLGNEEEYLTEDETL